MERDGATHRRMVMLQDVREANLRGRRPRLHADRNRNLLKAAGLIVGGPLNLPGMVSRGGRGHGWSITEEGLAVLARYEARHPEAAGSDTVAATPVGA